jgi:hypothetical protein
MKTLTVVALFLSLVPTIALAQAKPDFSGTWVLDVDKSWSGTKDGPRLPAEMLVVKQTATELTFEQSREPGALVVRLDGEESVQDSPMGRAKLRAKWEGDRLVMTMKAVAASILSWSLSADGKVLTVDGAAFTIKRQPTGEKVTEELKIRRVYQRQ